MKERGWDRVSCRGVDKGGSYVVGIGGMLGAG